MTSYDDQDVDPVVFGSIYEQVQGLEQTLKQMQIVIHDRYGGHIASDSTCSHYDCDGMLEMKSLLLDDMSLPDFALTDNEQQDKIMVGCELQRGSQDSLSEARDGCEGGAEYKENDDDSWKKSSDMKDLILDFDESCVDASYDGDKDEHTYFSEDEVSTKSGVSISNFEILDAASSEQESIRKKFILGAQLQGIDTNSLDPIISLRGSGHTRKGSHLTYTSHSTFSDKDKQRFDTSFDVLRSLESSASTQIPEPGRLFLCGALPESNETFGRSQYSISTSSSSDLDENDEAPGRYEYQSGIDEKFEVVDRYTYVSDDSSIVGSQGTSDLPGLSFNKIQKTTLLQLIHDLANLPCSDNFEDNWEDCDVETSESKKHMLQDKQSVGYDYDNSKVETILVESNSSRSRAILVQANSQDVEATYFPPSFFHLPGTDEDSFDSIIPAPPCMAKKEEIKSLVSDDLQSTATRRGESGERGSIRLRTVKKSMKITVDNKNTSTSNVAFSGSTTTRPPRSTSRKVKMRKKKIQTLMQNASDSEDSDIMSRKSSRSDFKKSKTRSNVDKLLGNPRKLSKIQQIDQRKPTKANPLKSNAPESSQSFENVLGFLKQGDSDIFSSESNRALSSHSRGFKWENGSKRGMIRSNCIQNLIPSNSEENHDSGQTERCKVDKYLEYLSPKTSEEPRSEHFCEMDKYLECLSPTTSEEARSEDSCEMDKYLEYLSPKTTEEARSEDKQPYDDEVENSDHVASNTNDLAVALGKVEIHLDKHLEYLGETSIRKDLMQIQKGSDASNCISSETGNEHPVLLNEYTTEKSQNSKSAISLRELLLDNSSSSDGSCDDLFKSIFGEEEYQKIVVQPISSSDSSSGNSDCENDENTQGIRSLNLQPRPGFNVGEIPNSSRHLQSCDDLFKSIFGEEEYQKIVAQSISSSDSSSGNSDCENDENTQGIRSSNFQPRPVFNVGEIPNNSRHLQTILGGNTYNHNSGLLLQANNKGKPSSPSSFSSSSASKHDLGQLSFRTARMEQGNNSTSKRSMNTYDRLLQPDGDSTGTDYDCDVILKQMFSGSTYDALVKPVSSGVSDYEDTQSDIALDEQFGVFLSFSAA